MDTVDRIRRVTLVLALLFLPLSALGFYVQPGYRYDYLRWNIPGAEVDILSELTWRDLHTSDVRAGGELPLIFGFCLVGEGNVGHVWTGTNRDSDYAESGRAGEWSRSISDVHGTVWGGWAGLQTCWINCRWIRLGWGAGGAFNRLDLKSHNGRFLIPSTGVFSKGVHSTYRADWITGWTGPHLRLCLLGMELSGSARAHVGRFEGRGDWRLRTEWDYFTQSSTAYGFEGRLNLGIPLFPCLKLYASLTGTSMWTTHGVHRLRYADGEELRARFNEARWCSLGAHLGLLFRI